VAGSQIIEAVVFSLSRCLATLTGVPEKPGNHESPSHFEVAAQKTVWRQLAAEREKVRSDYRKTFAISEAELEKPVVQEKSQRDQFRDAASGPARAKPDGNTGGSPITSGKIRSQHPGG